MDSRQPRQVTGIITNCHSERKKSYLGAKHRRPKLITGHKTELSSLTPKDQCDSQPKILKPHTPGDRIEPQKDVSQKLPSEVLA